MTHLKPMTKKTLAELTRLIDKLEDGTLRHDQSSIHCGTAHCVCGWVALLDYAKEKLGGINEAVDFEFNYEADSWDRIKVYEEWIEDHPIIKAVGSNYTDYGDEGKYTLGKFGLTIPEAETLFNGAATFDGMRKVLEHLGDRQRLVRVPHSDPDFRRLGRTEWRWVAGSNKNYDQYGRYINAK